MMAGGTDSGRVAFRSEACASSGPVVLDRDDLERIVDDERARTYDLVTTMRANKRRARGGHDER
jgi:hypothetical protein